MTTGALKGLEQTVGPDLMKQIQTSKILLVGSGGIGCELLKDLALSGFRYVEVIDLDTIDVSNLNRQLLFRSQHVGMAKCTVACQVAATMVPKSDNIDSDEELPPIHYQAHHGNVCDNTKFNVPFVQNFDLVLNALDNVEARRRVNRLCLAADTPLVEAGTTGYLGQVTVIHKSSSVACYECKTQETQKVYPICTIRSTPSMPVHTIVWSKELYKLLFHSKVEESMLFEDPQSDEPSTYMESVNKVRAMISPNNSVDLDGLRSAVGELLEKLYISEIEKQLGMDRYKAAKKTPVSLSKKTLEEGLAAPVTQTKSTAIWSNSECIAQFRECIFQAAKPTSTVLEEFDKDDDLAMKFVCAASNLRSMIFGITPTQSLYSAKGIAGNIIPAIATTNAICAGLQILQCFRILHEQLLLKKSGKDIKKDLDVKKSCVYSNCIRNKTRNGLYLTASSLESPNPNCFVCRNATIPLTLNVHEWTLERLLLTVVKGKLGFEAPTVLVDGDIVWEEGEGADSDDYKVNLPKVLSKLPCGGIHHGCVFELDDTSQNLSIEVTVSHQANWPSEETTTEFPFLVGGAPPKKEDTASYTAEHQKPRSSQAVSHAADDGDDDDDIVLVVDGNDINNGSSSKKRRADPDTDVTTTKKSKVDDSIIVID